MEFQIKNFTHGYKDLTLGLISKKRIGRPRELEKNKAKEMITPLVKADKEKREQFIPVLQESLNNPKNTVYFSDESDFYEK